MKTLLKYILVIMMGGGVIFAPFSANANLLQGLGDYTVSVVGPDVKIWFNDSHLEVPVGAAFLFFNLFTNATPAPIANVPNTSGAFIEALDMNMLPDPAVYTSNPTPWVHDFILGSRITIPGFGSPVVPGDTYHGFLINNLAIEWFNATGTTFEPPTVTNSILVIDYFDAGFANLSRADGDDLVPWGVPSSLLGTSIPASAGLLLGSLFLMKSRRRQQFNNRV